MSDSMGWTAHAIDMDKGLVPTLDRADYETVPMVLRGQSRKGTQWVGRRMRQKWTKDWFQHWIEAITRPAPMVFRG